MLEQYTMDKGIKEQGWRGYISME